MEPLLFRNGNSDKDDAYAIANAVVFQWSHFFSEMEIF